MSTLDLGEIRRKLEASKASLATTAPKEPTASKDVGLLGGAWVEGTNLGPAGAVEEAGNFLREHWDGVLATPADVGGLLGVAGQAEDGGPPDRLTQLQELSAASEGEFHGSDASALHCAFAVLFQVHQAIVTFVPNLNIQAAGQKTSCSQEDHFARIVKACTLCQNLARDVRNLSYSRYGREKMGWKDTSQFARKVAEGVNKHAPLLKQHMNDVMLDSIGLSTGGA